VPILETCFLPPLTSSARLNPIIFDEVERAFHDEMPDCKDWTAVNVWSKIAAMVAKISGRLFVGPELCRDEKYLEMAVNYAMLLNTAQEDIKRLRPIFKPWTAPRLQSVKKLHEARKELEEFLAPIVQSRRDAKVHDPNWIEPDDMLSWLMKRQEEVGDTSTKRAAAMQLGLNFAAILTTTLTTTNM
jgi:cytochrome P450